MNNLVKILDFLLLINKFKTTKRYSTVKNYDGDSCADHTWQLAMMAYLIAEELGLNIDKLKAVKMALVHDLAEAITGDIDVRLILDKKVSREDKRQAEEEAMKQIKETLPDNLGNEIHELWEEYEKKETEEAKFVVALDKIEAQINLIDVGHKIFDDCDLIATYSDKAVKEYPKLNEFQRLMKEKLKEEFKKGNFEWKNEYNSSPSGI